MDEALVGIIMGSESDKDTMKKGAAVLDELGVCYEMIVSSAHRNPERTAVWAKEAEKRGLRVLIAGAGLAAALPGVIAAHTILPVIGVPIESGPLNGQDALHSIVQMPPGVPVATVGIGNSRNAALLASHILALTFPEIRAAIERYRSQWD